MFGVVIDKVSRNADTKTIVPGGRNGMAPKINSWSTNCATRERFGIQREWCDVFRFSEYTV